MVKVCIDFDSAELVLLRNALVEYFNNLSTYVEGEDKRKEDCAHLLNRLAQVRIE